MPSCMAQMAEMHTPTPPLLLSTSPTPFPVPIMVSTLLPQSATLSSSNTLFYDQPINSILDGVLPLHVVLSGWNNIMKD